LDASLASLECSLPDPSDQPMTLENDTALEGTLDTMVYSDGNCRCCLSVVCHCCGSRVLRIVELPGELEDRLRRFLQCDVKIVHAGNRWAVV
jgi:hypothetical protein